MQHYVIRVVIDLGQVGGIIWVLRLPPTIKLTAMISLNPVESGAEHHKSKSDWRKQM
jgi:hypothetical protein